MVDRYRYFNLHKNVEKASNCLLKHFIDEILLDEASNSSDLRMRLRHIVLNKSAELSWSHQTSKVSKHSILFHFVKCIQCIYIIIKMEEKN